MEIIKIRGEIIKWNLEKEKPKTYTFEKTKNIDKLLAKYQGKSRNTQITNARNERSLHPYIFHYLKRMISNYENGGEFFQTLRKILNANSTQSIFRNCRIINIFQFILKDLNYPNTNHRNRLGDNKLLLSHINIHLSEIN